LKVKQGKGSSFRFGKLVILAMPEYDIWQCEVDQVAGESHSLRK
jgi:hypothetical protein